MDESFPKNKKSKTEIRHSRAGGNPETQSCKNLLEMAETQRTWIPAFAGMTRKSYCDFG
ncbi:hypothetical protein [Neisseria meningitidis]|uniref:hypothetical protein n=1 Tax=Neisseria meningitidis TaxID=487 RepID=UPI001640DD1F|nr:hypothetical protein [Neisseria meningitidis]